MGSNPWQLRSEAPVNGGRNYNGPKVAKFLVGQVPTCTNGVTIERLSWRVTQRTCSTGEDAGFPHLDGKTPCTFTTP
jgi:hypothetical protein